MNRPYMTIAAVERETGLSKDTLRVWERRYGFPTPERDGNGERIYAPEQVDKLRLVRRLMDRGYRPGRLLGIGDEALASLAAPAPSGEAPSPAAKGAARLAGASEAGALCQQVLELVRRHDVAALRHALHQAMVRQGLGRFVTDTVAPLNSAVGNAWMSGAFQVFEEHLYTEQMQAVLRQAIATLPAADARPRMLLTTVPDEQHILGLLMAECLFALEGASCVSLGTQTPLYDIRLAAEAQGADVVALSFSAAFPQRQVAPLLTQLRGLLPAGIALWAGGSGVERLGELPGVKCYVRLDEAVQALRDWRAQAAS
ncbi:MerR family transcriptional regulator [Oryzomicrobium sp.]|uniref:MerR family transcriptional regulator n=1 Tax=Oryzomicrobium sp. TaxID=1911578 RepID=UPI0025E1D508|nr:MerR family transcriptional regulator [Oryzomicrobium sp.]MCE1244964.1 MerR family transcriptional regulator [Oryzomicrobium sp.]